MYFFKPEYAHSLCSQFPKLDQAPWYRYFNPIENKYALNNFAEYDIFNQLFAELQNAEFVDHMKVVSGIENLENDPHLHGAGLHYHPRGGKLDMHLDYSIHPITKKERRLNLIIYLNGDGWEDQWGGDLQLWDAQFTSCVQKIQPVFNRAVLFKTNDISYHGLPQPLTCPDGQGRKSIAIYYVSDARPGIKHRAKAEFRPLPTQPVDHKLQALYTIRSQRVLTAEDLQSHYSTWQEEAGNGFW